MIPYHDENETQRTPYVTLALIGVTVLAWLFVQGQALRFRSLNRCATLD